MRTLFLASCLSVLSSCAMSPAMAEEYPVPMVKEWFAFPEVYYRNKKLGKITIEAYTEKQCLELLKTANKPVVNVVAKHRVKVFGNRCFHVPVD